MILSFGDCHLSFESGVIGSVAIDVLPGIQMLHFLVIGSKSQLVLVGQFLEILRDVIVEKVLKHLWCVFSECFFALSCPSIMETGSYINYFIYVSVCMCVISICTYTNVGCVR